MNKKNYHFHPKCIEMTEISLNFDPKIIENHFHCDKQPDQNF